MKNRLREIITVLLVAVLGIMQPMSIYADELCLETEGDSEFMFFSEMSDEDSIHNKLASDEEDTLCAPDVLIDEYDVDVNLTNEGKITLPESASVTKGETITLTPVFEPSDISEQGVVWTSSNPDIASVSEEGKVTGKNAGNTEIQVTTLDGKYTAKCVVKVEIKYNDIHKPVMVKGISTWDCIWFGKYWQEDTNGDGYCFSKDTTVTYDGLHFYDQNKNRLIHFNGLEDTYYADDKQPIKWRVLDIDSNGEALLLSDKAIDIYRYNQKRTNVTWERSTLRSFINSYDATANALGINYSTGGFLNNAFSEEEARAITVSHVVNAPNPNSRSGSIGGSDTDDKVFCLSIEEALSSDYGFVKTDITGTSGWLADANRKAMPTGYAWIKPGYECTHYGNCNWHLRSPGLEQHHAAYVDKDGSIMQSSADDVYSEMICVRPAIRLNLSANSSLWSYAGTVNAEGASDDPYGDKAVTGVNLTKGISLKVDETVTLKPVILPSGARNTNVTWSSSDTSIVTVSEKGVVTGVKLGTAYITVTTEDGGFSAKCRVDVTTEDGLFLWELSGSLSDRTEVTIRLACSDSTSFDGRKHVVSSVNGKETKETASVNPDILVKDFSVSLGGEVLEGVSLKSFIYKNNQYPGEMTLIPVMNYNSKDETIKSILKDHKDFKTVLNKLVKPTLNKSNNEWSNGMGPIQVRIEQIDITDAPVYTTTELKADKNLAVKDGILVWKGGNINISWKKYTEGSGEDKMNYFIPLKVTIPGLYYQKVFDINGSKKVKKIPLRAGGLKFISKTYYEDGEKTTEIQVERTKGACDYAISDELQQLDSKVSYIQPELNTDGYTVTQEKNSELVEVVVSAPGYFTGTLPSFEVEN